MCVNKVYILYYVCACTKTCVKGLLVYQDSVNCVHVPCLLLCGLGCIMALIILTQMQMRPHVRTHSYTLLYNTYTHSYTCLYNMYTQMYDMYYDY